MWPSHMFLFSMGMKYVCHFFLHHHQRSVCTLCSDKNTSIETRTYHHSILHEHFPRRKCILVVFNIYEVFTAERGTGMESRKETHTTIRFYFIWNFGKRPVLVIEA